MQAKRQLQLFMRIIFISLLIVHLGGQSLGEAASVEQDKPRLLVIIDTSRINEIKEADCAEKIVKGKLQAAFDPELYQITYDDQAFNKVYRSSGDEDVDAPEKVKKSDWVQYGQQAGYDYIAILSFQPTNVRFENMITIVSQRILNLELLAKIVDVRANKYCFKQTIASGVVSRLHILGLGSDRASWDKAIELCLSKFVQLKPKLVMS